MSKPKRAPLNLDAMKAKKPGADQAPEAAAPKAAKSKAADDAGRRIGLTVRLSPAAWKQLKTLALDEERHAHELLIDALNNLFTEKGKPPIA